MDKNVFRSRRNTKKTSRVRKQNRKKRNGRKNPPPIPNQNAEKVQ